MHAERWEQDTASCDVAQTLSEKPPLGNLRKQHGWQKAHPHGRHGRHVVALQHALGRKAVWLPARVACSMHWGDKGEPCLPASLFAEPAGQSCP